MERDQELRIEPTGNGRVDAILRGVIGIFETLFPGRIRGYYLTGSFHDGSATPLSDIDLLILFSGGFVDEGEEETACRTAEYCSLLSPIELDLVPLSEPVSFPLRAVSLKRASRLLYGEDVRDQIPLPPLDAYVRQVMRVASQVVARLRPDLSVLTFPLDYPHPEAEFFGYDRREMTVPDGTLVPCTKDLVLAAGLAAAAIVAWRAGCYVAGKSDCLKLYREQIGDPWTGFLEEVYQRCRSQWGYRVPEEPAGRAVLRSLCQQALAFENHFLALHRDYLLAELGKVDDDSRLFAVKHLGQMISTDAEVRSALAALDHGGNEELQHALEETIARIDRARKDGT